MVPFGVHANANRMEGQMCVLAEQIILKIVNETKHKLILKR